MTNERERLVAIVPAAPVWRAAYTWWQSEDEDLESLPDDSLFSVDPIACFAHTETRGDRQPYDGYEPITGWEEHTDQHVRPVLAEEDSLPWYGGSGDIIAILGPGQPEDGLREAAIRHIREDWKRRANDRVTA
jgi:hypothetical protein